MSSHRGLTYRLRTKTTKVVLHDTLTAPSQSNLEAFLAVKSRTQGLLTMGWHFLILRDGKLIECRPVACMGAHMRGDRFSIGIAMAGGLSELVADPETGELEAAPVDNFTPEQGVTLRDLFRHVIWPTYGDDIPFVGHSEDRPHHGRQCPSIDMEQCRAWIRS